MSLRIGGAAAIVGAVLFPVGLLVSSLDDSDDLFPGAALILVGTAAILVALIGLSSFQARQHPKLIWAAYALPAVGTVLSCIGLVGMASVGDDELVAGLSPWSIWMLGVTLDDRRFGPVCACDLPHARPAAASPRERWQPARRSCCSSASSDQPAWCSGIDEVAPVLTLAGLIASSIGWIAMGWTAIRLDQPAPPRRRERQSSVKSSGSW